MSHDRQCVVLIHGLWCRPLVLRYLRHRIERAGFHCYAPAYRSLRVSPVEASRSLQQAIQSLDYSVIHFVGHSLGGIVALNLLDKCGSGSSGRVVLLGSPVNGSELARRCAARPWLSRVLGRSYPELGAAAPLPLNNRSSIGVIAGLSGSGLVGWLAQRILRHQVHGDGLVAINETQVSGASMITVPYSHGRLLFSSAVANEVVTFLRRGVFCDEKKSRQG